MLTIVAFALAATPDENVASLPAAKKALVPKPKYAVSRAARLDFAAAQLAQGTKLKTYWSKCTVKVDVASADCFMSQMDCVLRKRRRWVVNRKVNKETRCFARDRVMLSDSGPDAKIVILNEKGEYRKKFTNVPHTFAVGLQMILRPEVADEVSLLDYGACVQMGASRARTKAVMMVLLGLTSLLGFIPAAGGYIATLAADAVRAMDRVYGCEAQVRATKRELTNEAYEAWMQEDEYTALFQACMKAELPGIFGVDQIDSVLNKVHMVAVSTIKSFSGLVALPVAAALAVKDIFAAIALAKVQYDHSYAGYYLSCLHDTVEVSMPAVLLKAVKILDEMLEVVNYKWVVQYSWAQAQLHRMAETVAEHSVVQGQVVRSVAYDFTFEDGEGTMQNKALTTANVGPKRNVLQPLSAQLEEMEAMSVKTLDLLSTEGQKLASVRQNCYNLLDLRWRYNVAIDEARTEEMATFKGRMYWVDAVRYPLAFVVKGLLRAVKGKPAEEEPPAPQFARRVPAEATPLSHEAALVSHARVEALAGLDEPEEEVVDLYAWLEAEAARLRQAVQLPRPHGDPYARTLTLIEDTKEMADRLRSNDLFELVEADSGEERARLTTADDESEDLCDMAGEAVRAAEALSEATTDDESEASDGSDESEEMALALASWG